MDKKLSISVIVIAKNEEKHIERCLKCVNWASQVIVVDNDSTDATVAKAKLTGASVESYSGNNFSDLRNFGKSKANEKWIFYIDADEYVSESLKKEIIDLVQSPKSYSAYKVVRENYYLGSKWPYRENIVRFFQSTSLIRWYGQLHETALVRGSIGQIRSPLEHHTHENIEEMVSKTNEWSKTEAMLRIKAKHPAIVPWRMFRVMLTAFYDYFVKQKGWKAGIVGIIESLYQSFSIFITYAKLWELQQKNES